MKRPPAPHREPGNTALGPQHAVVTDYDRPKLFKNMPLCSTYQRKCFGRTDRNSRDAGAGVCA
jgi:hypothetical protein